MTTFAELNLADPILRALTAEGYESPTPIQAQAIPTIMDGRDVMAIAQTGAGKTAAFVLPLLNRFVGRNALPAPAQRCCNALILAPTRELAQQIGDCIRSYGRFVRPSYAVVVGGAKMGAQVRALSTGVDILVATPGRLLDHLGAGTLNLGRTGAVVLDEGDLMMDLGFIPAIRKIVAALPADRQSVMLSATMPKPIRALANEFLNNPVDIACAQQSRPVERIEQKLIMLERSDKRAMLVELLSAPECTRAIVFTRTKHGADRVADHLDASGLRSAAIHGDKTQGQRERALGAFRAGVVKVLVATDIAARGIDVDAVSHVVNFEIPNVPETYVHRIGRTGRAGADGVAISLCDSSERGLVREIEKVIGRTLLPARPGSVPHPHAHGHEHEHGRGRRGGGHGGHPHAGRDHGGHAAGHAAGGRDHAGGPGRRSGGAPRPAHARPVVAGEEAGAAGAQERRRRPPRDGVELRREPRADGRVDASADAPLRRSPRAEGGRGR